MIDKLKELNLLNYIETETGKQSYKVGSNVYRFKNCPLCGGGDHFNINPSNNLYNTFGNCGGGGGSIIDFYMNYYSVNMTDAINALCKNFNINNDRKEAKKMEFKKRDIKEVKTDISKASNPIENIDLTSIINNYYISNQCNYNYFLTRLMNVENYFTTEMQLNFDKLFNNKFLVGDPKEIFKDNLNLLPGLNNISSYEYIFPIWENGKVVNCILRRNDNKSTDNCKTLNLKGLNTQCFNIDYLKNSEQKIFITEGIFDCLSFEMLGFKSISINSTNNINKFLLSIKENINILKDTKFIIALDNDEAGQKAVKKIIEGLNKLGLNNLLLSIDSKYKDINEYYLNDIEGLKETIDNMFLPPSVYKYMSKFLKNVEINKNTKVIETGFEGLNEKLNGGFYPGLYTIGAISSLGKTALTLQIADNIAKNGQHVLFFSLEMPRDELISRSISRNMFLLDYKKCTDISTIRVLNGKIDNVKDIYEKAIENYITDISRNLTIIQGNFNMDILAITGYTRKFIESTGIKPVVFVDYLQIIDIDKASITEKKGIDNIVKGLKMLSRDFNIPVMVVSSFNRASYQEGVSFESFKESGGIEYTSDFVMGLQLTALESESVLSMLNGKDKSPLKKYLAEQKSKIPREITLVILKNRNGISYTKQNFKFYPKNNIFGEV